MLVPFILATSLLLQQAAIRVEAAPQQPEQKPFVAPFVAMAEPPKLPKVDLNSCPFEGCQFGKWTATKEILVYSTWEPARKQIATLQKGDEVTGITGVNLVLQPGRGVFDRDVPLFGASKGDTAYMYQNCGEGAVDIWVHGRFIQCMDPEFSWKRGYGCSRNCNGRWLERGKSEWWAQIRLKDGTTGWVLMDGSLDGVDALG
jgi:hypothetical protein